MKKGYVSISQEPQAAPPSQPQYMSDMHHEKSTTTVELAYSRDSTAMFDRFREWCRQTYTGDRQNANAPLLPCEKRHVSTQPRNRRPRWSMFLAGGAAVLGGVFLYKHFMPGNTLFQGKSDFAMNHLQSTYTQHSAV